LPGTGVKFPHTQLGISKVSKKEKKESAFIMRKQTKIAAIVSAAALLAVGASMTSFAATGWQEEDGTWVYYNKAEEKVTEKWAKSGDNWFYLDGDGYMATDMLIEDDEDYYYVDANGAMVRNQWIAIDNEDAGNDDDEPEVHWYYFQNNGKAYRKKGTSTVFKKSINGKTYCFNEDGQMQYGWVDDEGQTNYDDDAWKDAKYYFGDENDGAMSVGWRLISITDDDATNQQPGDAFWDEDQDRWFYFKSSGKKYTNKDGQTLNGRKYGFDESGRMIADWALGKKSEEPASASDLKDDDHLSATASTADVAAYAEEFRYYSSPEDGARHSKGWFKVIPGSYLDWKKYDDGSAYWYYANSNGKIVANEIKTIKSKKYAFDERGRMLKGLVLLEMYDDGLGNISTKEIVDKKDDDEAGWEYDNEDNFDKTAGALAMSGELASGKYAFYFFSNDEDHDGSMKTGKQTITLDGDPFTFRFYTSGSHKGQGITGIDDKKLYMGGKLIASGKDEKFQFVETSTGDKLTVAELLDLETFTKTTKDDETIWTPADPEALAEKYVLVNTSGAIQTSGTKKDGDDYKVYVKNAKGTSMNVMGTPGVTVKNGRIEKIILK
jgi:glucan-binding YG repeat protein